jgi:hypothetical protein
MLSGRLDRYRSRPALLPDGAIPAPDAAIRLGKPAEPFFAVWVSSYRMIHDPLTDAPAAFFAWPPPLRIRPLPPGAGGGR